ncbi:uncharacterized protein N7479_003239 [Penicillium vulpinum]|uniref:Uncharacterized protein n=1 Tax=Penicillium vulpinum TaxID=29845 RepID=A0A1V6S341_9EURO|nr:uncharacterized protein N7479_003239 [Penicillium vulpinum]KAJ5963363.1 hypothetical protein N7479_003239 [Penicillium vulpinum]OQE08447.1 hypothetical protein PENVUL_c009G03421 [Penicillium vulpinum]
MDHISTLCALSTLGIAPTGLALGRAERTQRPSLFRRKTLTQGIPGPLPINTEKTEDVARPKTAIPSRSPAAEWLAAKEEESSQEGPGSDLRKAPLSFSGARRRRRGQTLTNPPLRIPEHESTDSSVETHARRPSTGWLRRLSMASFQPETPTAGSPVAPSFNGSETPIFSHSPRQRRSPNKLIKRPTSQHTNAHPLGANTICGPSPAALRRPATSHQRSESMILRTPLTPDFDAYFPQAPVEGPAIEEFELDKQKHWTPFFFPKAGKLAERLSRRFSTATAPKFQSVRHIVSDYRALPALVMADAISPTASTPREDRSVPQTPIEFSNPFQTAPSEAAPKQQLAPEERAEKPSHKQSYSVNDVESKIVMANTVTAHGTPIMGLVRGGSLKRVKGRTFSVPPSELAMEEKNIVIPSPPEAEPRRNITDPSVFRAPYPTSQSGWADSALERRSQVNPRSVSQDYSVGLGSRAGSRQMTSDAVALSAWQQASRPGGRAHGSLRRRPKGFSISGSDPASTIIGSDDTRVFTSCDGYETDVMSDYWDSVRTRETNRSGLKGLRIETMFDKAGTSLVNEEATTLEALLPRGSFAARSLDKDRQLFTDPLLSSPPLVQKSTIENPFHVDLSDDDGLSMIGSLPGDDRDFFSSSLTHSLAKFAEQPESRRGSANMAGSFVGELDSDINRKTNIFDWSEQAHPNRESSDLETRPRTMQGKQEGVNRSSRAVCRKAPSTVHLRSQSVPVASELPINESRQTSGKFGTWGLGSKGVSEDWDSDFDFDESDDTPVAENKPLIQPDTNRQSMTVPKAILERQASLRGQFGQVQELTLLVEELKRLRHQANVLGIVNGPSSELWAEAEQIVNLATIDDEEERHSPPGSPSSLTFSFDESDDDGLNASSKRNSEVSWDVPRENNESALPLAQLAKDSPKSNSVLDILQSGRDQQKTSAPTELELASRAKKLPFDTSSLKNLVSRAGVVTRSLKEVIRKADGVATSPPDFPQDPPFRRIFDKPSHDDMASFEAALADMS